MSREFILALANRVYGQSQLLSSAAERNNMPPLFPPLVLKRHQHVWVVRDDLFPYGSKARFLYWYFKSLAEKGIKEVVYGSSPRWGYAQISIAFLARHFGLKSAIFLPLSKVPHPYTAMAEELGAKIFPIKMGFTCVCEKRARDYAEAKEGRIVLPIGLDVPEALDGIRRWAGRLDIVPDEVWTVASSGTLTRGLQTAWPSAKFVAVRIGRKLSQADVGKARIIECPFPFGVKAKLMPPFPSVPEYDAKGWTYVPKEDDGVVRLFWNVGG